jgi:hypothetical protein
MAFLLSACAGWREPATSALSAGMVSASVRALNYTGREIWMIGVEDPGKRGGGAGDEALNPYSGGGMMCCFSVPEKWDPEFRLVVTYSFYPEMKEKRVTLSLPPYPEERVGSLWLLVYEDESAEAIVSEYDPDHPQWPGKVKGRPKPSREYLLKLWQREVDSAKSTVALFEKSLIDTTDVAYQRQWDHDLQYSKKNIKSFTGPDDPAYRAMLKDSDEKALALAKKYLENVLRNKP